VTPAHALRPLRRMLTVLKVVVAQIDVLETMTPGQFAGFRARLDAASGFQSAQFRELEAMLGRRDERVARHYPPGSPGRERILAAMARPSLYDSLPAYPRRHGYPMPERDPRLALEPSEQAQEILLTVYLDDGQPASMCELFVDLDEGMQEWRYRHVKMVERTIGDKGGTGGSSGAVTCARPCSRRCSPTCGRSAAGCELSACGPRSAPPARRAARPGPRRTRPRPATAGPGRRCTRRRRAGRPSCAG
jgi:tryptophan 2,3-dioxygenase